MSRSTMFFNFTVLVVVAYFICFVFAGFIEGLIVVSTGAPRTGPGAITNVIGFCLWGFASYKAFNHILDKKDAENTK